MKPTRYFHVFYVSINKGRVKKGNGNITISVSSGGYLNKDTTREIIEDELPVGYKVIITNIVEITESDYNDWNA
jgi:methyl coenzyme M reductase subunit D